MEYHKPDTRMPESFKKSGSRALSQGAGTALLVCPCAANRSVCVPSDGVSGLVKNSNSSGALLFFRGYSGSRCAANCYVVAVQLSRDPYYNHDPSSKGSGRKEVHSGGIANQLRATILSPILAMRLASRRSTQSSPKFKASYFRSVN